VSCPVKALRLSGDCWHAPDDLGHGFGSTCGPEAQFICNFGGKSGFCVFRPHPRTESTLWPVLASKLEPLGTKSRAPAAQNGPAGSVQSSRDSQVWVFGSVLPPVGFVEGLQGWLRSNKCARKCCSGLIWSCLALPNAGRACSEAACVSKRLLGIVPKLPKRSKSLPEPLPQPHFSEKVFRLRLNSVCASSCYSRRFFECDVRKSLDRCGRSALWGQSLTKIKNPRSFGPKPYEHSKSTLGAPHSAQIGEFAKPPIPEPKNLNILC